MKRNLSEHKKSGILPTNKILVALGKIEKLSITQFLETDFKVELVFQDVGDAQILCTEVELAEKYGSPFKLYDLLFDMQDLNKPISGILSKEELIYLLRLIDEKIQPITNLKEEILVKLSEPFYQNGYCYTVEAVQKDFENSDAFFQKLSNACTIQVAATQVLDKAHGSKRGRHVYTGKYDINNQSHFVRGMVFHIYYCPEIEKQKTLEKLSNLKHTLDPASRGSEDFKEAVSLLYDFLMDATITEDTLKINQDKLLLVTELLSILLNPEKLDQGQSSLCGIEIYLRTLAEKTPVQFITLGLELAKKGVSDTYLPVKGVTDLVKESSIIHAMLASIRDYYNHPLVGYSSDSPMEVFEGATLPKDLVHLFRQSDYVVLEESMVFKNAFGSAMNALQRFAVGGIYSSLHRDLDPQNIQDHLRLATTSNVLSVHALISGSFATFLGQLKKRADNDHKNLSRQIPLKSLTANTLLGIRLSHYVRILSFSENESGLNIVINTYGRVFSLNNISLEFFNEHFQGIITAKAPQKIAYQPNQQVDQLLHKIFQKLDAVHSNQLELIYKLKNKLIEIENSEEDPLIKMYLIRIELERIQNYLSSSVKETMSQFFSQDNGIVNALTDLINDKSMWIPSQEQKDIPTLKL